MTCSHHDYKAKGFAALIKRLKPNPDEDNIKPLEVQGNIISVKVPDRVIAFRSSSDAEFSSDEPVQSKFYALKRLRKVSEIILHCISLRRYLSRS